VRARKESHEGDPMVERIISAVRSAL